MGKSSREKGKRGEREWRTFLIEKGFDAERTGWKQSHGGDEPDVTHGIFAAEVKRHKRWWPQKVYDALEQARKTGAKVPYHVGRGDNEEWLVAMDADTFVELAGLYSDWHEMNYYLNHQELLLDLIREHGGVYRNNAVVAYTPRIAYRIDAQVVEARSNAHGLYVQRGLYLDFSAILEELTHGRD